MKSIKDIIEVLAESLICIFAFVIIIWLLSLFDSLSGKQYEIIITFLGVIATFVVINNFHQVGKAEQKCIEQIEEQKKLVEHEISEIRKTQNVLNYLLKTSSQYRIAQKVVEQNSLDVAKKFVFDIKVPAPKVKQTEDNQWICYQNVKIDKVVCHEDELQWTFLDINNNHLVIKTDNIISIRIEEFAEYCEECSFNDPYFIKLIKHLLSQDTK